MIGKTISHYKILEKLGEGGMGVVYKAEDTKLRRIVALKFLKPEALQTEEERTRFVHEAQAAAGVEHPNICTIHEIDEADGRTFISMAYIEGRSLKERIESGPLDVDEALGVAAQVAEGLKAAHEAGIVHRDIKSGNIMVTSDGQARVMDFGLAKLAEGTKITKTGTTVGTAAYMSPEQTRGEGVDQRTDIWSLGVVLYEMVTGQLPFRGDYEQAILYSILNEQPEPMSQVRPGVPAALENLVERALEKRQENRYPGVEAMLEDLRKVGMGDQVRPALSRIARRRRRLAWVAGLILAAGAAVLAWPLVKDKLGLAEEEVKTLAVVGFENIGAEDADHLVGGLAEGISVKLSKLDGVRVVSTEDIRRLRREDISAKDVASRMGADYAVGGSLLKAGEKVRITPQLIDVTSGDVVWSDLYDSVFEDVFLFLDDISLKIVEGLRLELTPAEAAAIRERLTESAEAYNNYLKARHFYYRSTMRDNELAEKEFQKALRLDPDYALAMAGLADTYVQRYKERYDYDELWLDQADGLIERALELKPDLAEAYESRAEVLLEKQDNLGASEAARKAMDIAPDWDEPYVRLGEISERRGENRLAVEMYERALAIRLSVDAWCGKGSALQTQALFDSAEVAYRMALSHNPDHDRPFYQLGWLHWDRGDPEGAERMFRRAIEVRPDRGRNYHRLMWVLYRQGRIQEAEELLRHFVERYPYNWDAYEVLWGFLAWNKRDFGAAVEVLEDAVENNPDRVWPHLLLAFSYAREWGAEVDRETVVKGVSKALELRPESSRVLEQAAEAYLQMEDFGQALHYYKRALDANPGSASILGSMASLLLSEGKYDSAAVVARKAIEQSPGVTTRWWGGPNYRVLRAALSHLLRTEEYLAVVEEAAEKYGEDNPYFFSNLGEEQCLAGKYREAISSYERALEFKRGASYIVARLGMAQWLSGDTEDALESFRQARDIDDDTYGFLYEWRMMSLLKYLGRFDKIEERLAGMEKTISSDYWCIVEGDYYSSMRRFEDALAVVARTLESEEGVGVDDLMLYSAVWNRQKGDLDNARRILKEAEASSPPAYQESIYMEMAITVAIEGDLPQAQRLAEEAAAGLLYGDTDQDAICTLLGKLYYACGQVEKALIALGEARAQPPTMLPPLYHKGQLGLLHGSDKAEYDLRKALLFATRIARGDHYWINLGEARCYCALASARLGDSERAKADIKYALRLEPERADVAYHAACTYSIIGDIEEALDWLQTAVDRGHQELWWARVDPDLDNLREEPRFSYIMSDWDDRIRALLQ